ncbi:Type I Iterative PKS [Coccidioides posadasii str. Silveira]|uniref:Type I Iterative PKS n=1 Tax=Coccidioides posadasii (strain RMSCC 757 / Silveira) TaxID=443226 RepID=UPI001BED6D6F|nr:Type I Iterative PKS [Coccidioides posadasii str. Silveira]
MGSEPIAIIGLSCKFAGDATSPAKLWTLLEEGRSAWSEIPSSRFNPKGAYHPSREKLSTSHIRGGHFLEEDLALFDAAFFNFSAETASTLDPQFRLQLESVYEALENAGLPLSQVAGSNTSVFAGTFFHDYRDALIRDEDNLPRSFITGIGSAMASNRISHFFDLRGASMTIDTGCSTTLVALHQAVENLRSRGSEMSIVGGANVLLNPDNFKALGSFGFLSPDGKCFAFDERANGYGRGEGVATIVIKRLEDALAAGDPIRAIIRESVLNQDGKTESLTSPSQAAQEALMRGCYAKAGLEPLQTQYFEAHGTGTATGDPIEAGAIASVFQSHRRREEEALRIGSVKTNIGHTEATSGLASVIKVVLAMEKGVLPPSINFEKPNPQLALDDWRLKVVTELEKWPVAPGQKMRASVNNFGYGGSNAHIIMEDANGCSQNRSVNGNVNGEVNGNTNGVGAHAAGTAGDKYKLLLVSAKDEHAHENMVARLADFLRQKEQHGPQDTETLLQSLAYTLGQRRTMFPWVAAYPVPITQGLDGVAKILETPKFRPSRPSQRPRIGMVFTGQGAQWYAMGRELITTYPVFKASLEEADGFLRDLGADWSLMEELGRDAKTSKVNQTAFSIPICAAVQISLVRLLETWGVTPSAVTSHSSGEIAAAYTVGAISLRLAMGIAYYRSRLAAEMTLDGPIKGGMLAVGLGHGDVEKYLERLTCDARAVVACINSPSSTTVAGDIAAIEELETLLKAEGLFARRLRVDTAYHSHHMEPVAEDYRQALRKMPKEEPKTKCLGPIAFASPVTGYRMTSTGAIADPEHWVGSLMQPVQFVDAFIEMVHGDLSADAASQSVDIIVEIGPHTALGGPIQEILTLEDFEGIRLPYYGSLVRHAHAVECLQTLASNLLREGYPLDIEAVNFPQGRSQDVRVLTDLPSYPWNHQTRHWLEPRFNLGLRQRDHRPHELLGSLVPGTNPEAPVWRHILRATESPWVQDHVIQSKMLYPGCGFICLAIEAATQQLAIAEEQEGREISGYRIRDMSVQQALVIPDTAEGIEIQTALRPVSDKAVGLRGWKEFEVLSITPENRWMRHAQGLVMVEFDNVQNGVSSLDQEIQHARLIDAIDMWSTLESLGIKYGLTFRNISDIRQSKKELRSTSTITVPDTSVPNDLPRNHIIHPATLDAVAQAAFTPLPGAAFHQESPRVFQSIERLWVSSKINREAGQAFQCHTKLDYADVQGIRAGVVLVDQDRPVVEVHGLQLRSLGGSGTQSAQGGLCARVAWERDLGLNLHSGVALHTGEDENLRRLSLYFMEDALADISPLEADKLQGHYRAFYAWMKDKLQFATPDAIRPDRALLTQRVAEASPRGEMLCRVGPCLAAILRSQRAPQDLMDEGGLLEKWSSNHDDGVSQGAALLRQIVHKQPRARVLEIGARLDVTTRAMLEALGPLGSLYHFTNASDDDFKHAEQELAAWGDILMFDTLDVAKEPSSQGFELGNYDVVIASGIVQPSTQTLANVQALIKPGGKLLMVQAPRYELDRQLVLRLLPEWWDAKGNDPNPSLEVVSWDQLLKDAGFSGVDVAVSSAIISVVPPIDSARPPRSDDIILVTSNKTGGPPPQWLEGLRHFISTLEPDTAPSPLPDVYVLESASAALYTGKICVFLGEINQPMLRDMDATVFEAIKAMTTKCKGLLWVTRGGSVDCEKPDLGLAAGFLRAARSEYLGRSYVTLDLDPSASPWSEDDVQAIVQVLKVGFDGSSLGEFEYAMRDGVFKIPRVLNDTSRNRLVSPADAAATDAVTLVPLRQADRALSLQVGVPGRLDTLSFTEDASLSDTCELSPEMVEIEPRAYGINARDVMVATGQLRDESMGLECAGIITRVGTEAAAQGYTIGDNVFGLLPRGQFGSIARTPWTSIMQMLPGLSFEEAASLPMAYCTAYICLTGLAHLQREQTVLIHAAAGSVGQAAIMIARHVGAEVFVTVGTPEKRELMIHRYGIPEDHLFSSRDTSFGAGVLSATHGRGIDVVLNSLSGSLLQESFNVLAPFGHLVEIGQRDLDANSYLAMRPFNHPASFSSFSLLALAQHNPRQLHRAMVEITQLVGEHKLSPVHPLTSYPMRDVSEAFRHLQTESHVGKAVLSIGSDVMVPMLRQSPTPKFSPDASYLLVGGVGGIGCSIARWMADQGAKNVIILSRSAGRSEQAAALVDELSQVGCRVKAVSCNVSSGSGLADSLRQCQEDGLPPIRGVIQGAMVLKDTLLERMTLVDYQTAIHPKVHGTWNLHTQFAQTDSLDFFVMLSSAVAVAGNVSQANYAAGGSYQDALARWRVSQGLPGVSINLGAVKGIGVAANTGVLGHLQRVGYSPINEEQVLSILGTTILHPYDPQVVVGLDSRPGSHWDAKGESQLGRDMRFAALKPLETDGAGGTNPTGSSNSLASKLATAKSLEQAVDHVGAAIAEKISDIFMIPLDDIDLANKPAQYGIDSLVAVELRNMLVQQAAAEVSIFDILQSVSLAALAAAIAAKSAYISE